MSQSYRDRVAAYFLGQPNRWISHRMLMRLGGECAWRTRVSDCRKLGMQIDNRIAYEHRGGKVVRKTSFYRYVPPPEAEQPPLPMETWA